MTTSTPFQFENYKDFIRAKIGEADAEWGIITKLAKAAHCHRSYLSRVLSSPVHLTLEQVFGLCEFWKLSPKESEYLLALVERDRGGIKSYQNFIESKLKTMRLDHEDLSEKVRRPHAASGEREHVYYSAWYWSAIHILTSVLAYQSVEKISRRLQLPEPLVTFVLEELQRFGYVKKNGKSWSYAEGEKHLPKSSALVALHHQNGDSEL